MFLFFKWPNPISFFVYFRSFHSAKTNTSQTQYFLFFSHCKDKYSTNWTIHDKSVNDVLGTGTQGVRIDGVDETTELWLHPSFSV